MDGGRKGKAENERNKRDDWLQARRDEGGDEVKDPLKGIAYTRRSQALVPKMYWKPQNVKDTQRLKFCILVNNVED